MRRIVYSVAASLDGFIAGPNGEYDWIIMDPEIDFAAIFARFDTLLMGRRTYEVAQGQGEAGPMQGVKSVVVSRTLKPADHPRVTIIGDKLAESVDALRRAPGKDIWLFGGGQLLAGLLELGLVDEVEVAIIPVLLGAGIPLVAPTSPRATLRLTGSRVYQRSGIVSLAYEVVPARTRARRAAKRSA